MTNEIEKYIKDLEGEIKSTTDSIQKDEALLRLEEAARTYQGEDEVVSWKDIAEDLKTRPEEKKIMTGYKELDDILSGFRHKQLIVVSAATKSGKTSFCIEMTSRMKEYNPMWLPFKEPAEELILKFLDRKEDPPHAFSPKTMKGNTLTWVEKKIIEAKAKYDSQILFIDHLHFIIQMGENMSQQIGITMRELKRLAVKWNVVIILIAHLKKTKMEEQPTLEDLRDSSFIAQEADTVIMLWRETKKELGQVIITNNVNISVQANRKTGKTGNVKMIFQDGKFLAEDWRSDLEQDADMDKDFDGI